MSDFLTARELAERLRVKPTTVQRWMKSGVIPVVRINRKVIRFDAEAVRRALEARGEVGR